MFNDKLFVHVSPFFGVPVMDGDVGHRAEGHKGRSQAGAKGHQLEVGPQTSRIDKKVAPGRSALVLALNLLGAALHLPVDRQDDQTQDEDEQESATWHL